MLDAVPRCKSSSQFPRPPTTLAFNDIPSPFISSAVEKTDNFGLDMDDTEVRSSPKSSQSSRPVVWTKTDPCCLDPSSQSDTLKSRWFPPSSFLLLVPKNAPSSKARSPVRSVLAPSSDACSSLGGSSARSPHALDRGKAHHGDAPRNSPTETATSVARFDHVCNFQRNPQKIHESILCLNQHV